MLPVQQARLGRGLCRSRKICLHFSERPLQWLGGQPAASAPGSSVRAPRTLATPFACPPGRPDLRRNGQRQIYPLDSTHHSSVTRSHNEGSSCPMTKETGNLTWGSADEHVVGHATRERSNRHVSSCQLAPRAADPQACVYRRLLCPSGWHPAM
eukprot:3098897-Rhodomonas_salina.3